ncbi:MAG TPA: tyrosine-type recombinase/integrase [Solirubrobacteraceae bacterium]|nr:tyrosine-type recombinase/integrase [Solirubrobacteraceae bacterium]
MSKGTPSRTRVEPGIQKRVLADGTEVFDLSFRDSEGKQRRRVVRGGITAARKALRNEVGKRDRGERAQTDPRLTFNQAADAWWEMRVTKLRPATQSAYGAALNHLRPVFGRQRLSAITPADVARFITARQARAKGWTIRGDLTVLGSVFKHASRHMGFAGASPVAALDRVERPSIEGAKPARVLTRDEVARLLASVDDRYRMVFELAACTGARLGEVLGLVWSEVDLEEGTVLFTHQLDRSGKRAPLKTARSRRKVEIPPPVVARLTEAKLAAANSGDHAYVLTTRVGTPHDHRNIKRVMDRAVKRAGLEAIERDGKVVESAPTPHDLRHTHGSQLIASGDWDIAEVSARLGHADVSTTMRIYIHEYDQAQRSQSRKDRLAAMYAAPVAGHAPADVVELPTR